ncbi:hypothetical protein HYPSUDRAFT_882408 [Hypholoma sublateritium FD-334 SS-4]|uniref:Uncharacterized protein n=1 Tax=Hypholoma sublateritium (strain FD-334 SS-4) TaxID=945553 RepID=A0A0D2Q810_HYPSF|nr:hypothetical protein HYPSUDRAFT_882408 [Hypholoma sublateritium FD-334 SS-4]
MHTFYTIVPALSLLNMGVNGAIIANTLSSRRDGNAVGSGPYSVHGTSRQTRQFHAADFHSDGTGTESSDSTPSGLVSPRQNPAGLTNNIPSDVLSPLLPVRRFMQHQDAVEGEVRSLANEILTDTTLRDDGATGLTEAIPNLGLGSLEIVPSIPSGQAISSELRRDVNVVGNAARRQDSDSTIDTGVATIRSGDLLDSIPSSSVSTTKMVKRRVRRQDDSSDVVAVASDAVADMDPTGNSGSDAEVETIVDTDEDTSANSLDVRASVNELD